MTFRHIFILGPPPLSLSPASLESQKLGQPVFFWFKIGGVFPTGEDVKVRIVLSKTRWRGVEDTIDADAAYVGDRFVLPLFTGVPRL